MSKSPEITLVIPTLNEVDNIDEVFQHLSKTDLNLEVIIVDSDSKDGTREQVKTSAKKYNLNARAINTHKLDLSNSAVVGFREATAKYAALMDADLQHPPKMLQEMFEKIKSQNSDVVLASKYVPGSQLKNSFFRLILSKGFIYMSYFFFPRLIKKVKEELKIPVIGNGDVFTPEDFKEKLNSSKVDYILIARGAIGNPYIFKQIDDYMKTGTYNQKDKLEQFNEYLKLAKKHKIDFSQIKSQAINFTKGIRSGGKLRVELAKSKSMSDLTKEIDEFKKHHKR